MASGGHALSAGSCSSPIAIIIEPARDLAEQTAACLHDYCRFLPSIKVQCFIGSSESRRGRDMLDCHIAGANLCATCVRGCALYFSTGPYAHSMTAVATPGRLLDLVQSHALSLAKASAAPSHPSSCSHCALCFQVRFFVLDEADRLLETGNLPTISEVRAPKYFFREGISFFHFVHSPNLFLPPVASLASPWRQRLRAAADTHVFRNLAQPRDP